MKQANPKLQLLRGASRLQRNMIDLLVARGTLKASELSYPEISILQRLQELGATAIDVSSGTWYLSDKWNEILEAKAPSCPKPGPLPRKVSAPAPIPDAPRSWTRPKAEYSNQNWEKFIDDILHNR